MPHTGPSPLRRPEVINALHDLAKECEVGEFNRRAKALLLGRFNVMVSKGTLAGIVFREGIAVHKRPGATDGAAAVLKAQRLSNAVAQKRDRTADHREVMLASTPDHPRMLSWRWVPPKAPTIVKRFHPKAAAPPVPVPPRPAAPPPAPPPPVAVTMSGQRQDNVPAAPPAPPVAPRPVPPVSVNRPGPILAHRAALRPGAPSSRPIPPAKTCCWPIGEPQPAQIMKFCDEPVHPSRPYCLAHCKVAYQGFREDRHPEPAEIYGGLFPGRTRIVSG